MDTLSTQNWNCSLRSLKDENPRLGSDSSKMDGLLSSESIVFTITGTSSVLGVVSLGVAGLVIIFGGGVDGLLKLFLLGGEGLLG